MRIAICDDTLTDLENAHKLILHYYSSKNINVTIETYDNPKVLLNRINHFNESYDLYILDVVMQENGIDVAGKIKEVRPNAIIIFETSSKEFALDAYGVKAIDYILKPLNINQVSECLDRINSIFKTTRNVCQIKTQDYSVQTIDINSIIYIESLDRRLLFHMSNNEIITTTSLREKFINSIPFPINEHSFVQTHSSYIVNLNYVKAINDNEFTLSNGEIVPISKRMVNTVKSTYIKYLLGE